MNLSRTAVEVVIPERQQLLLEVLADYHGLRQETEALLREVNHPYAGWSHTLADLHRRAMSDFHYVDRHERGAEAVGVYLAIYRDLATERLPGSLSARGAMSWIRYLEKAVRSSSEHLERNAPVLLESLEALDASLAGRSEQATAATTVLGQLVDALGRVRATPGIGRMLERAIETQRGALRRCYEVWLEAPDPMDWLREIADGREVDATPVASISHDGLRAALVQLDGLDELPEEERSALLADLPDQRRISRLYLEAAAATETAGKDRWDNLMGRIAWLARVVSSPDLESVRTNALYDIRRCAVEVLREAPAEEHTRLVASIFEMLHPEQLSQSSAVLALVTAIGTEILHAGSRAAADLFVERMLDLDFQAPDFQGFTADWKPRVHPIHLPNVRAYLALIQENPALAARLLASLVIHLRVGGIFVADTDLFQKDVSALLAADIGPVYHLVKTLVRLFPVYFNEIGAEGELRDVSTRIDEIGSRRDRLAHFLRKQCHVESNPRLVQLVEEVVRFWTSGDKSRLQPMLPSQVHEALDVAHPQTRPQHEIFAPLAAAAGGVESLMGKDEAWIQEHLAAIAAPEHEREKAKLTLRLRELLRRKYALDHDDLLERLAAFSALDGRLAERLRKALEVDDEEALRALLEVLGALKRIVLDRDPTEPVENIYHKRHIAVGIPSMYGEYREPRFEAMGLILRADTLAAVLLERLIDATDLRYVTRATLARVQRLLRLLVRVLRLEGFNARAIGMGQVMLEQALASETFTVDQFLNVFQFLSRSVNYLVRVRFLDVYENDLQRLLDAAMRKGLIAAPRDRNHEEARLQAGERFLRELIAASFGPQLVDDLIGRTLRALSETHERLGRVARDGLLSFDVARSITPIDGSPLSDNEGPFLLGYKGYMVKRLAQLGFPTPPGFILTTESFRCRGAIDSHPELRSDAAHRVRRHLELMSERTGRRLGDPTAPLFLSVRSGAPVSMPGMMDTFLNVGMTPAIVESFADSPSRAWAGWDAYRRFLQFWGMSSGLERDLFDRLMRAAKERASVPKKALLPPDEMKRVALDYATAVADNGVVIPEDPFEQLMQSIGLVQDSWNSDTAVLYRQAMRIAEEWGTAVIVQQMVFGNLGPNSGTGVVFTRHPHHRGPEVELFGDFILQSQGDDVVSGLVETFPVSERQRRELNIDNPVTLEHDFPAIYQELTALSSRLIEGNALPHQEIEFTFEGPDAGALYLLQTRDMAFSRPSEVPTFVPCAQLDAAKIGTGIGVGGGAMSGRAAYSKDDVQRLKQEHPDDPVIVLRPDTVPDDIAIILAADGLLTTLGGSTSHAAVAAQRLGRTCVVGCRALQVNEEAGLSRMGGHEIRAGDEVSINGIDGSVYLGMFPVTMTARRGLA